MRLRTPLFFAAALALTCAEDDAVNPPVYDAGGEDISDGSDGSDATDATDATDSTDGSDSLDASDASDASDGSDATDGTPTLPVETADQKALVGVPVTETWTLPGLEAAATVVRTEANVPHVYAQSRKDLGRVIGFVLARDRFFFMDLQRRLGLGTISDLLGELGIGTDMEARLFGTTFVADRLLAALSPEARAYFDAVAEGINAYIDAAKAGELPIPTEFATVGPLLGKETGADVMQPFSTRDLMAMAAVLMYQTNFESDIGRDSGARKLETMFAGSPKESLRTNGYLEDVWFDSRPLFPGSGSSPGFGTAGLPGGKPGADVPKAHARKLPVPASMLDRLADKLKSYQARFGKLAPDFGSNAWAVGGTATTDGSAMVASDGHLQLSVPSLMYQVALDTSVFGGGPIAQIGSFLSPFPILGVGTNGKVAWGMVNPVVDITDWYREELALDDKKRPVSSTFKGKSQPLVTRSETYVIADVPALGSTGRTEVWERFETFDGRWLVEIEGKEIDSLDEANGAYVANMNGDLIIPGDTDGDGKVTAISFDHGALDATSWPEALYDMGLAEDIHAYRKATRGLVGGGLFMTAGDKDGNVLYSSYQAIPCRGYLQREGDRWAEASDPGQLLDGTVYGGFTLPTSPDGSVDDSQATDPYKCAIPFDAMPQSLNPAEGYVFTANNDPAVITDDGNADNDTWYLGGPWTDIRANTIRRELAEAKASGGVDTAEMRAIQGNNDSRYGERFSGYLRATIEKARALPAEPAPGADARMKALYTANAARFEEVYDRLGAWATEGFRTPSGVETFYSSPTAADREAAIATSIFNAWMPRFAARVWDDEPIAVFRYSGSREKAAVLSRFLDGRGADNPSGLASHDPETGESVFFDRIGSTEVERSDELMLVALEAALDFLTSEPKGPGEGGFGSANMSAWLWGLRHLVRFESLVADYLPVDSGFSAVVDLFSITTAELPLADSFTDPNDPRKDLKWFPRGGDNDSVDASGPGWSGTQFTYGSGPVMRMVIRMKDGEVEGHNVVPGGQSGIKDSPFFADQARLWLGNKTLPMRLHPADVVAGATGREAFVPAPSPK